MNKVKKTTKMKKVTVGSTFSEIGAFEVALEKNKIKSRIVFACDNDKFVKQSYDANYKYEKWYDDIKNIDGKKYKNKIDLLTGGLLVKVSQ